MIGEPAPARHQGAHEQHVVLDARAAQLRGRPVTPTIPRTYFDRTHQSDPACGRRGFSRR